MWSARLSLMVHLKMYKEAESELSAFGELVNPDLYYQYHPNSYPGRKGMLVNSCLCSTSSLSIVACVVPVACQWLLV